MTIGKGSIKSSRFFIEPFNGQNDFTLWQQRVKNILTREGCTKALKPKSEKPEKLKDEEWQEMRELANSTIQLYLGNTTLREVINESDPAELWAKLESRYKSKSLTNRLSLKKQLYALHMGEGKNFMDHLDEFNRLLTELDAIGAKIEEEDKAILLLVSLPSSYEHLRTTLMYGKDTLGLDEVVAALISHESMRRKDSEKSLDESAMVASDEAHVRGRTTERQGGSNSRGCSQSRGNHKKKCYYCDLEGHIMRNCRKLKADKEKVQPSDAMVIESFKGEDDLLSVFSSDGFDHNVDWVFDSGCSFHMCADRKLFATYYSCKGSVVKMANNTTNRVVGEGTIRLHSHDGRVVVLTGVRHVPGLRKNLISLGMLDSKGFNFSSKGGVLEVSKNGKMMLKGQLDGGNLYKLLGNVVWEKDLKWVSKMVQTLAVQNGYLRKEVTKNVAMASVQSKK